MASNSIKILLAFLCTITIIVNSQTRTCAGDCRCGRRSTCTLRCRGEDQCKDGDYLRCRSQNNICAIDCDGKAACNDLLIDGRGAADVRAKCEGEDACKASEIDCDDAETCTVNCDGKSSCGDADIDGGDADSLTVVCDGEDACKGSGTITCPSSQLTSTCEITCRGSTSCEDVTVVNGGMCTCSGSGCGGPNGLCNNGCNCVAFAAKSVGGKMVDDLFGDDQIGNITLNMSKNTIINLWSMAILFVIINGGICFWMNKNKNINLELNKVNEKFVEE